MRIVSTLGKVFGGLILVIGLCLLLASIALSKFTEYQTLQPILSNIIANMLAKDSSASDLQQQSLALQQGCQLSNNQISVNISQEIGSVSLNCSEILQSPTSDIPKIFAKAVFDQVYYKEYPCGFIQCIQQLQGNERFLIFASNKANKFFSSLILPSAAVAVVGIVLLIVSIRKWYEIAKSIGIICIFFGITLFAFPIIQSYVQKMIPADQISTFQQISSLVLETIKMDLMIILVVGIILTVIGFVGSYLEKRKMRVHKSEDSKK